jgi:uncharacterized protein YjbK
MMPREFEIKIDLQKQENFLRLIDHFNLANKFVIQENHFFDSEKRELLSLGWALRLRMEKRRACLTLKGVDHEGTPGLAVRTELESEISPERAARYLDKGLPVSDLPGNILALLKSDISSKLLSKRVFFRNKRYTAEYGSPERTLHLEIDQTEFSSKTVDYELEVELPGKNDFNIALAKISTLLGNLDIPVVFQNESKFARALIPGNHEIPESNRHKKHNG